MKTITEFSALTIRQAAQLKATLTTEGVAPEAEAERFSAELSLTGDRLARLIEALSAVGDKADRVRLVRVFAGDAEVKGATKIGEFNYVVDLQPNVQAGGGARDKGRRGGPGGDRGKPGGGGGLGGGKGPGRNDRSPYEKEPPRGEVPSAGPGWMVTRAPQAPGDRRGPGGARKPGRPGQRPGNRPGAPGGDRGRPGGGRPGPGGNRPGGAGGPPGQRAGGPGGNGPPGRSWRSTRWRESRSGWQSSAGRSGWRSSAGWTWWRSSAGRPAAGSASGSAPSARSRSSFAAADRRDEGSPAPGHGSAGSCGGNQRSCADHAVSRRAKNPLAALTRRSAGCRSAARSGRRSPTG